MRTLNSAEIQQVSGAGVIADAGSALGAGIGAIIDVARHRTNHIGEETGSKLGRGIGTIIEAHVSLIEQIWGRPAKR